jgi:hypothetical protein
MKRNCIFLFMFSLLLSACSLAQSTLTPTLPKATFTPENTVTPTNYPCPQATQELPPYVYPLTSPTNEMTQTVIISGRFVYAVIQNEAGVFEGGYVDGQLKVVVSLAPNAANHLTVTAHVPQNTWNNCTYGGYTMSTVTDGEGNPLTIVQGIPPTPAASTQVISVDNIKRLSHLGTLENQSHMNGAIFAGEFELLTFGYDQPNIRWSLPDLQRVGTIGPDEAQLPAPVTAAYYPNDVPARLAIAATGNPRSAGEFSIRVWNLADDSSTLLGGHSSSVQAMAFSPSGKLLASGSSDDVVKIWDTQDGRMISEYRTGSTSMLEPFYCMYWPDDTSVWAGGYSALYHLNAADGSLIEKIAIEGNYACDFAADGSYFAATYQDVPLVLVNLKTKESTFLLPYAPQQYPGYLVGAAVSPDGSLIAAINYTGMWFVWRTDTGELLVLQAASLSDGYHIRFSPDGRYLVVSGWETPVVEIWGIP